MKEVIKASEKDKGLKLYSHSRLWLFDNCPEAFKAKYIDKIYPELPASVEAFLGNQVHESLEWLYNEGKGAELDDLIINYAVRWRDNFDENIKIINGYNEEHYFNKGVKFLIDYYLSNMPDEENTIETEKRIVFALGEKYGIQGFVDRIVYNLEKNEYEVHDYKTNNRMKAQDEVDKDRQLAFYHLGLQELFGKQIKVKLIWHFLAHNKKIISRRNQEELDKLKEETLILINKIETNIKWPACGKRWCDWCSWKNTNGLDRYINVNGNRRLNF